MVRMVLIFLLAIKVLKNAPLCIFVPKISAHRRDFDKTKCMSFLIKDEKLLKRHTKILEKVRQIIKRRLSMYLPNSNFDWFSLKKR